MTYPKELIDKWRDVHVDDRYWYESTIDYWKNELLPRFGIVCDSIDFSGFWSQGDGASFVGWVENDLRFITFMTSGTKAYPLWRKLAERAHGVNIKITRESSRYVHENSVTVSVEADTFSKYNYNDDEELLYAVHAEWDRQIDREAIDFERDARDFVRALNRYIYRELEAEYTYLTSDEAIIEWLDENPDVWKEDAAA